LNTLQKTFTAILALLLLFGCNKPKMVRSPFEDMSPTSMLITKAGTYKTENLYTDLADSSIESDFRRLIANGAKVDSVDEDSNTALILLAQTTDSQYFPKTAALAEILLENKADVNKANYRKLTPLHLACLSGNKPLAELLLANGADIEALDNSSCTPVVYAVTGGGHAEMVELLARHKADLSWKDPTDSMSLLDIAERRGYTKTSEFLKTKIKSK
jgi:ankyrin repeat protein